MCPLVINQARSISAASNGRGVFKLALSFGSPARSVKVISARRTVRGIDGARSRHHRPRMRPRFLPILLALATLPLAQALYPGCATMIDGPTQQVRVKSQPRGAQVLLNGKPVGVTPVTAVVSRWGWHRVRIETPGYEPYELRLEKHFNGNAAGNLFIGGVWIVVDALTGAIYDLGVSPEEQRKLLKNEREKGDPLPQYILSPSSLVITVGLKPAGASGPARKIGQMKRQ